MKKIGKDSRIILRLLGFLNQEVNAVFMEQKNQSYVGSALIVTLKRESYFIKQKRAKKLGIKQNFVRFVMYIILNLQYIYCVKRNGAF